MRTQAASILMTIGAGLLAGGLAGAGVALGWYGPMLAVLLAAVAGAGVGLRIRALRREREGATKW